MSDAPKVRPQIAAKNAGPGPRYMLPPGETGPKFSLGAKLGSSLGGKTAGPGPSYKVNPGMTTKGAYNAPKFTMAGRAKETKMHCGPGPGAYSPENVKVDKGKKAPEFTMAGRTKSKPGDKTPASNAYSLKSTMGNGNKISMTGRSKLGGFDQDFAKAPGPGKYGVTGPDNFKKKAPSYTMAGRTKAPQDPTKKPGPGTYKVDSGTASSKTKRAPSFTMGSRHSDYLTPLIVDVMD